MTQKVNFIQEGKFAVWLELLEDDVWRRFCQVEMCALEDNYLAREVPETRSFEPIIYLRCGDLDDERVSKIQYALATGQDLYCRLRSTVSIVTEVFHFEELKIREFYRCAAFVDSKDVKGQKEGGLYYKSRWMITGLRSASP